MPFTAPQLIEIGDERAKLCLMPEGDLSLALTILRVIRGWNQDDLAKASGVRNSSVSDYERGKTLPELRTILRMVNAMGFPLSALDHAQTFIHSIRTASMFNEIAAGRPPAEISVQPGQTAAGLGRGSLPSPAALQWEVEQVSADLGGVVSRMALVMFTLVGRAGLTSCAEGGAASPAAPPAKSGSAGSSTEEIPE